MDHSLWKGTCPAAWLQGLSNYRKWMDGWLKRTLCSLNTWIFYYSLSPHYHKAVSFWQKLSISTDGNATKSWHIQTKAKVHSEMGPEENDSSSQKSAADPEPKRENIVLVVEDLLLNVEQIMNGPIKPWHFCPFADFSLTKCCFATCLPSLVTMWGIMLNRDWMHGAAASTQSLTH